MPLDPQSFIDWRRRIEHASPSPWRTGRCVFRTLYSGERLIGMLDRPEDAAFAATAREAMPLLPG
jgi:hypothetical protein